MSTVEANKRTKIIGFHLPVELDREVEIQAAVEDRTKSEFAADALRAELRRARKRKAKSTRKGA